MKDALWVALGAVLGFYLITVGLWIMGLFLISLVIRDVIVLDFD